LIIDHAQRHLLIHQGFLGLATHRLLLAHTLAIRNDRRAQAVAAFERQQWW
jgi:FMN-dependent NADH-azoreductase